MKEQIRADHLQREGFAVIRDFMSAEKRARLEEEIRSLVTLHYHEENLSSHSVYPSDVSENRVSHAMMIAEGTSTLPAVSVPHCPTIAEYLRWSNHTIAGLSGRQVAAGARSLINWQEYRGASKPVGEHFDGEYLRANKQDAVEFTLLEGILPRYVCVLTLKNENEGRGLELIKDGSVLPLSLYPGDLVFFDNIALRHRVPRLECPRSIVGLRNFDHMAVHFVRHLHEGQQGCLYRPIAEGYISEEVDCQERFKGFLQNEWPTLRDSYGAYV